MFHFSIVLAFSVGACSDYGLAGPSPGCFDQARPQVFREECCAMFMCFVEGFKCERKVGGVLIICSGRGIDNLLGRGVDNLFESIGHLVARKASSVVHVQEREQRLNLVVFTPKLTGLYHESRPST